MLCECQLCFAVAGLRHEGAVFQENATLRRIKEEMANNIQQAQESGGLLSTRSMQCAFTKLIGQLFNGARYPCSVCVYVSVGGDHFHRQ